MLRDSWDIGCKWKLRFIRLVIKIQPIKLIYPSHRRSGARLPGTRKIFLDSIFRTSKKALKNPHKLPMKY
ncbi:hypothetical protein D1AOALGA4SA_11391 [Olavius algarvensis Delta 1 endosymbiont]|nr:hypothetical protein D1AOALGA4SA_11391 [Olavius algarvensis Delta 1 endosymbiont]